MAVKHPIGLSDYAFENQLQIVIVKWSVWARELESLWGNFTDLINRENKPCAINRGYNYIYYALWQENVVEGLTSEA